VIVTSLLLILVAVTLLVLGLASGSSVLLVCSIGASLLAAVALVVGARQAAAARSGTGYADDERVARAGDEDDLRVHHHRSTARATESGRRAAAWGTGDSSVAVADPMEATVPPQGAYRSANADDLSYVDDTYGDRSYLEPSFVERPAAFEERSFEERPFEERPFEERPFAERSFAERSFAEQPYQQRGPQFEEAARHVADPVDEDDLDDDDADDDPIDEPAAQYVPAADAARVARMSAPVMVVDGRPRYHLSGCVHLLTREGEPLPVSEAVELGFTPCSLCEPDSALLADARRV
jgi:hypothetical protein